MIINKSKLIILFIIFLIVFFLGTKEIRAESFYVRLEFKETKIDSKIRFEFQEASALYGLYDSFFVPYTEDNPQGDYVLEAYNSQKEIQGRYWLSSSRYVFWDSAEGGGGVLESDTGQLSAVIPYDRDNPTAFVRIASGENLEDKTSFIPLPVDKLEEEFKKFRLCIEENQKGNYDEDRCCSGLIPATQEDDSFVCVNCGDGKCSQYENNDVCPEDCLKETPVSIPQTERKSGFLLIISIILSIVAGIFLIVLVIRGLFFIIKKE